MITLLNEKKGIPKPNMEKCFCCVDYTVDHITAENYAMDDNTITNVDTDAEEGDEDTVPEYVSARQ